MPTKIWTDSLLSIFEEDDHLQFVELGDVMNQLIINKADILSLRKMQAIKYLRRRMEEHGLRCTRTWQGKPEKPIGLAIARDDVHIAKDVVLYLFADWEP